MTNDELSVLILPWAKTNHPDKYTETLRVAVRPDAFRKYMLRLVEIRCQEEPDWRATVPVRVLDETALVIKVRDRKTGEEIEMKGRRAHKPIQHRIGELALDPDTFALVQSAKDILDLEYVYD